MPKVYHPFSNYNHFTDPLPDLPRLAGGTQRILKTAGVQFLQANCTSEHPTNSAKALNCYILQINQNQISNATDAEITQPGTVTLVFICKTMLG